MKILMTGGTGYLGSYLTKALLQEGHELRLLVRPTSDIAQFSSHPNLKFIIMQNYSLEELCFCEELDGLIHCATNYGRNHEDLYDTIAANLSLPLRLLNLSIKHKLKFFISSDTSLDKRISYYSLSKSHFKDWLHFFGKEIRAINMELSHFFGPHDDPSKFATMIFETFKRNEPKLELTPGDQKRRFLYIDDVVEAFLKTVKAASTLPLGVTNVEVGSAKEVSIKEFVLLSKEIANNSQTEVIFGAKPYRENETMTTNINLDFLYKLGWKERYPLREAIERSI